MPSFHRKVDARRAVYLELVTSLESQLRDAYARLYDKGLENQSTVAKKLGVGRSEVCKRLNGHRNMTIQTAADMAWALGVGIEVNIFDPNENRGSNIRHVTANSAPVLQAIPSVCKPASPPANSMVPAFVAVS